MRVYPILDCPCIQVENENELKLYISSNLGKKIGGYSVAINAEKIVMYSDNPEMHKIISSAAYPIPDGAGATLGMRWLHGKKSKKVNFPQLVLETASENKYRLLVIGSSEETNSFAVEKISRLYPSIHVVGRLNGYFEDSQVIDQLIDSHLPNIVIFALGSPKQEKLAASLTEKYPSVLFVGCGGALDVLAGKVKRAPAFFINTNLEWLYRLMKQPSRYKRQKALPVFFFRLLKKVISKRF